MSNRQIIRTLAAQPTSDGDGVKIRRVAAFGNMGLLDPFLLLDEIASDEAADYIGGFPPHPHRGFETITYMLAGQMRHTDHMGNEGLLKPGGIQWMTAGRGVIHAEMPEQNEGRLHGFQIWLNLPASHKMTDPHYQEFDPDKLPVVDMKNGSKVKVVCGQFCGTHGPVKNTLTDPLYLDITLPAEQTVDIPVPETHTVLVYCFEGSLQIGNKPLLQGQLAQLGDGNNVTVTAENNARMLFLAGKPLREPIANYGPFVMNTREEIEQAINDYRNGTLIN